MTGDFIPPSDAQRRNLDLESFNSTTSVSSSMRISLSSPPGHAINCVIAAGLHLNGHVRIVEGGVGYPTVTVAYETIKGDSDLLFVLIESHTDRLARVSVDGVGNSKVVIVYDRLKDWRLNELPEQEERKDGEN